MLSELQNNREWEANTAERQGQVGAPTFSAKTASFFEWKVISQSVHYKIWSQQGSTIDSQTVARDAEW